MILLDEKFVDIVMPGILGVCNYELKVFQEDMIDD